MFFRQSAAILLSCVSIGFAQAENRTLVFAPLPMEAPEIVVSQWKPLLNYLESKLGLRLRIEYSKNYEEILEKFRTGKLDLAYLGPLPYVVLKDRFPAAMPLVHFNEANGQPAYTCTVVALAERKLDIRKLRGMRVALTQPLSTCGYLAGDGLLRQSGTTLEANHYRYFDMHDAVAQKVARGDYDFGVLKSAIGRKYAHLGLTTLAETPPLPSFALVINSNRLSAETVDQLRAALVEADSAVRAGWGDNIRHGAVPATDKDYDPVRRLRGQRHIPAKGNF